MPFVIMLVVAFVLFICWMAAEEHWTGAIAVGVITVLIGGGLLLNDYSQTSTRTIVVEGKDRGGSDGSYRVYTDGETLAVKDIWMSTSNVRTDSADLFGDIKPCHRYVVVVRGWSFGFLFSMMPNIDHVVKDLGRVDGCEVDN